MNAIFGRKVVITFAERRSISYGVVDRMGQAPLKLQVSYGVSYGTGTVET